MLRVKENHRWSAVLATGALLLLLVAPFASLPAVADPETVTDFADGSDVVTLRFRQASFNATAGIELPRGSTVLSARLDVEGIRRRGDEVTTLDLDNWNVATSPHRAWRGYVQGNYPPSNPFWNPYSPRGTAFSDSQYDDVGASDDTRLETDTGTGPPGRYPFHLFRFTVPEGDLTGLRVEWEGYGYCLANSSTRGAELFVWRNTTRSWIKVDWYSKTEAAKDRVLGRSWTDDSDRFVDNDRQVFALVYGKRSDNVAGPNPWTADGEVHTDYVRVNATLKADLEDVMGVSLSISPSGELWSHGGAFVGTVTLGPAQGLATALQQAVDAEAVEPGNITIPLQVNVSGETAGVVRLSNLSITYEPLVNRAPTWIGLPALEMEEDVDAPHLLDLETASSDDHSYGRLVYEVVHSSTDAIEAFVEDGHYLSFRVVEENWHGQAAFRMNATDPWGLSTTSPLLTVDVREVNDPPVVSEPGRQWGTQGEPFHYTVEAYDVEDDPLGFSIDTDAFTIDASTGEIDFTPTNDHVDLHRINVTVSDGRGGLTRVRMELEIANVNDPPVITDPGPLRGRQGETFEHHFQVDDPDLPHGDVLTWLVLGDDFYRSNLQLNPVTGEMMWRNVGNDDVGVHVFSVQVVDSNGAQDQVGLTLTIDNVNDPPIFPTIPALTAFEDRRLDYNLRVTDPDLSVDPDEVLAWTVEPPLFEITPEGTFRFVPTHDQVGEHSLVISVADRAGESHSQVFSLTIMGINHPPAIEPISDQVVLEDEPWTLDIVVSDPDEGDVVQVTSSGAPFKVPSAGGRVQWTPQERHGGDHLVTIEATDRAGLTTTISFNLTVITHNDPPTAEIKTPGDGASFGHGEEVFLSVLAQDEEGEHLTITWKWRYDDTPDAQWELVNTGPTAYWTQPPGGRIRVRVEVSDGANVTIDEVVFKVEADPDEEGGLSTTLSLGIVMAVIVVMLLVILYLRGGLGRAPGAEEPPPEDDEWEMVTEEKEQVPGLPK